MPTDPASIPEHVVEAALDAMYPARTGGRGAAEAEALARRAIAAALGALFNDEPVEVYDVSVHMSDRDMTATVRPSEVLAAVLARA